MNKSFFALGGAALLLLACNLQNTSSTSDQGPSIRVSTQFLEGSFRSQAVVSPLSTASVDHVLFNLFIVDASGSLISFPGASKDIPVAQVSTPIQFNHLFHNTRYRISAIAMSTPADNTGIISSEATADIVITNDDRPQDVGLQIKLNDVPFSAEATATGISFVDGGFVSTHSETLQ